MRSLRQAPLLLAVALSAAPALADDIYRWVDASGEVHYTNNPSSIPPELKKGAKVTQGDDLLVVQPVREPRAADKQKPSGPEAPPPSPGVPAPEASDEALWRDRFRKGREEISWLEAQAQADRAALANPEAHGIGLAFKPGGGVVPNPELDRVKARLARTEQSLEDARRKLEELDRAASREAVPREWRR